MYWFILLFPLMIYPWGPLTYYTFPKVFYLDVFVLCTWLYIILKKKYWTTGLPKSSLKVEYIVLVFMCLVGISTLFSVNRVTSFYGTDTRFEGLVSFFSYCSVFLFSYRLMDGKKLDNVIPGMVIISVFVSIYGILQHYLLDFFPRNALTFNTTRSFGFFDNANFFGAYLVLMMMLAITLYVKTKESKLVTMCYFFASCIAFVALIFSQTRSGWIGVFCGIVFLTIFVIAKRKYLWKKWTALLLTLGLLFVGIDALEGGSITSRLTSLFSDSYKIASNQSTGKEGSSRFFIWKETLPLVKEYFWVGSGPDTLEYVFPASEDEKKKYLGSPYILVDKAHNEYLQIAVTLGLPALLTYLLLLFVVIRKAFQAVKYAEGREKLILYGLISTIIGYLVQAFFNISTVPVAPLFWAILGITLARSSNELKKSLQQNPTEEIIENNNQIA
ncbi:O-antigen ligase family protein [Neobacillus niacini]|uniref:O-antigen ligase family protein n=1 Tax=Neobacillus niacini TaxID=86668 RepID=UPI0020401134|nr:O-antigen ligase family protein [Neobacillus niacini]MCM3692237.1 O-antigen ligase family protein [Neobacillus niacini]